MTSFRVVVFACLACLCLGRTGFAQSVIGSTTLDLDQSSGMVTATCETDIDADVQAFYEAEVECKVKDSNGKEVATGLYLDKNGVQGYAQVVLTFKGVPGTTYKATGGHMIETIFSSGEPSLGQPSERLYYDPFDFSRLDADHERYAILYEWVGHGLDLQRPR